MTLTTDQHNKPTWMHGGAMLSIWWPVLAFVCYSIFARVQTKFFAGLLVASGMNDAPSLADILFLYRQDLIIFGVILPFLTAFCFVKLRFAVAAALSFIIVLLLQILLYANLQSWGQVGSFLTLQSVRNAMSFGMTNPEFVGDYLAIDGLVKLAVLLLASAVVLIAGRFLWKHKTLIRLWGGLGWLSVAGFALVATFGHSSNMRRAPIAGSFVLNALAALTDSNTSTANPPPTQELDARYRQLAEISQPEFRSANFGAQKGSNLIIFVMETASIEFLDTRNGLPDHPALNALKDKMYVGANHFSTFPASAESNLSILTGAYPPRAIYGTCLIDLPQTGGQIPTAITQLRRQGYKTALYSPFRGAVPADKVVFEATGFEEIDYGDTRPDIGGPRLPGSGGNDLRTVDWMIKDIGKWAKAKQPFAAAFFPQVGHGPWSPILGKTVKERGEKLAKMQLDWLGQIIDVLRAEGQLDNSVIVLTGDHGIRTTAEDPKVKAGMINWYSFHVPLMIYAPRADYSAVDLSLPTSHVDIPAELDELYGLPRSQAAQGLALLHPDRKTRRSFLMAGWYYGANGYRDPSGAVMYSDLLDAVYARTDTKVEFGTEQLVTGDKQRNEIRDRLAAMTALQEAWISERTCPKPTAAGKTP
jgi:phosphoglycerol transferase MdoB-like AlkP superfamily enzyme